jgi:hypothetical protein
MKRLFPFFIFILISGMSFSQAWMQSLPKTKAESELTFFDYQQAFRTWCLEKGIDKEGYFINSYGERQKAYGWKQFKRWEIQMEGWYDPVSGAFLYESIGKEIARVFKERQMQPDNIYGNWTSVAYSQEGSGNDGNGRINCIAFHPTNENIFWIGTAWGGVWKTTDHGATWNPISDFILTTGISSIAIPTDYDVTHTIYIGTGDRGYNLDYGRGILKSTDDGVTWQETGFSYYTLQDLYINRLIFLPGSTTTLIACTNKGVFKSSDGFDTRDTLVFCKGIDMEFNPGNSDIIYVSTRSRHGDSLTRVLRTVDAGLNWDTVLAVGGRRTELAVSPDEPNWVYAVCGNNENGLRGFYRSTNSGATFQLMEEEVNILAGDCDGSEDGGQASYDLAIAASPLDAQIVFVGGVNVWKTSDGGASWNVAANGYHDCGVPTNVHVDIHWLEFQYATDNLFVTSDGGIYYSLNNGTSYTNISGGLQINQPYRLCSSQLTDEIIMGQQDNGIVLWEPGDVDYVGGGDGTDCIINASDPNNQFFTNNSRFITYTINHWADRDVFITPGDTVNEWFKPIVVIPPSTVYYGGFDLWKSTLKGANMTKVHDFADTTNIRRIAICDSDHDVIMLFNNEHIWRTEDGGTVWFTRDYNLPAPVSQLSCITIKSTDPDVVWVTFTGWQDQVNIYKSIDGGLNWFDFSAGLPSCPYSDIVQNVIQSAYDELYTVCYFGVYVKLGDNPWVLFSNGLPNVTSFDLDIKYGAPAKLRCATHGRGVWESNLYSPEATMPGIWTGVYSTDWHDNRNWQYLEVPSSVENVTIPSGCPYNPHIYLSNANCTNITIESGAVLTISARRLYIGGNAEIDGKIKMVGTSAAIYVTGNLTWKDDGLFENVGTNCYFENQGDWLTEANCDVDLTGTTVTFKGNDFSVITNNSADFSFGNLAVDKVAPYSLSFGNSSATDLLVNGNLSISATSRFTQLAGKRLEVQGNLDAQGYFFQQEGTYLCSQPVTINFATSTSYFSTLQIDHTGITEVLSEIEVRDTLKLTKGTLSIRNHELQLGGDLKRSSIGYISMTSGKIVFNGSSEQTLYNSINLQKVELDILNDTLQVLAGLNIFIDTLQWSGGAVSIGSGSSVSIDDLINHGISGTYRVKSGATLNITNLDQSVNLNGKLFISGGTVNVYGGNTASYWPDAANAELHMSSGTLDFKDVGIFVRYHPTYTFTDNITGGVIRTSRDFMGDHTGFNPSGGMIELYGPNNAWLGHGPGSSFYKVVINKGATTAMQLSNEDQELQDDANALNPVKVSRPGDKPMQRKALPPSGTRANKVTVVSNLDIDNNLDIESGVLDINGFTVDVGQSLDIYGTLNMLNSSSLLNVNSNVTWRAGSFSNVTAGTITFKSLWTFTNGTNASFGGSNTVKAIGSSLTYIYHKDPDATFANLLIDKTGSALYLDDASAYPLRVNGNLSVTSGDNLQVRAAGVTVNGILFAQSGSTVGIQSGGSIDAANAVIDNAFSLVNGSSFESANMTVNGTFTLTDGGTVNADDLSLYGLFDVNAGSVLVHNSLYQAPASTLTIDGGSFIIDKAYTGNFMSFSGTTNLNGGFFEISHESIQFGTGAVVNMYGGNLRVGGHFKAIAADSFKPDYGAVELVNSIGAIIECTNGNYFHELIINKNTGSNPCMLAYPTTINTNLTINSGELSTMNYTLNITEDLIIQPNGKLTAGSSTINVGEDWVNNRGTNGFAEGTSSVWLVSSQPCQISSETFYDLDLDKNLAFNQFANMASGSVMTVLNKLTAGDGTLRMNDNCTLNLNGDLHLKAGGGLNANAVATGTVINVFGQWDDYNPVWSNMIGFASGQSTVYFKGTLPQELNAVGGASFYNLVVEKSNSAFTPANDITVVNDFNLISGEWRQNSTGLKFTFKGDFTISDPSLWLDQVNNLSFEGNNTQTLTNSGSGWLNLATLEADRPTGSGLFIVSSDINCSKNFKVISGEVTMDAHRLICEDSLAVLSDASVSFSDGASIAMGNDGSIYVNGGSVIIGGSPSNRATVTRYNTGYFEFLVEDGGEMQAAYTDFEYLGQRGLNLEGTGLIEGSLPLLECSFSKGEPGGTLLLINNNQDVTLHNLLFPTNTWSGASNISKGENAGNVYLPYATGGFAGPFYEYDPFSRIHWPSTGVWEGDVSADWHDAQNWLYNLQAPDAGTGVEIPSGKPNYPVLTQQASTVKTLKMEANTSLSILQNSLTVNEWADIRGQVIMADDPQEQIDFYVDSLVWQPGSSVSAMGKSTFWITGDMFIRQGTNLNMTAGEFRYTGTEESRLICHDTATIFSLYNAKTPPASLSLEGDTLAQLTINGNFQLGTNAILKCPSTQEWVLDGGVRNTSNGHFRCQNGTIRLSGTINPNYFRVKQGDYFNNLVIDTLVNLYTTTGYSDTLRVNGDLTLAAGTEGSTTRLTANAFRIMLRGDWINNAGASAFVTGAGQTHQVHFWEPGQRQEIRGNSNFNGVFVYNESEDGAHFYDVINMNSFIPSTPVWFYGTTNITSANFDDNLTEVHLDDGAIIQITTLNQGGLVHVHDGSLTVNDLNQNYVTGSYTLDNGSLILKQAEYTTTHDLFYATLTINGGEMYFIGGSGQSKWPSITSSTSELNMTGGLFYLQNHSVEVMPGNFSENISGGTIRLPGHFIADAGVTSFHPTGGIVELFDDWDVDCGFLEPQCWFHNLYINKSGEASVAPFYGIRVKDELKLVQGNMQLYGNPVIVGP